MSRIRSIKPEYWTSEQVMACARDTRLLFIGIWNFCDDAGRMSANAKTVKAMVFPGDEDLTSDAVRGMIDELSSNGLICLYTVDGKEFLQVLGWRHQKIDRPQPSKFPPPPAAFDDNSTNDRRSVSTDRKGEERIGSDRKEPPKSEPNPARAGLLKKSIVETYQLARSTKFPDTSRADLWIAQGYDPAICIAVIREILPRKPEVPLNYFDGPIRDAHAAPRASTGPPKRSSPHKQTMDFLDEVIANGERNDSGKVLEGDFIRVPDLGKPRRIA
jgi:hypothetical protein